jgi:ribonuclease HI
MITTWLQQTGQTSGTGALTRDALDNTKPRLTAKMEAIADILEFVNKDDIPSDLTIHLDAQVAIARVGHAGTGPGQDRAIRVVKAAQKWKERGWRTSIEWVPSHSGIEGNERADQLAGEGRKENRPNLDCLA